MGKQNRSDANLASAGKTLRILLATEHWQAVPAGGVAVNVTELLREFNKQHSVCLLVPKWDNLWVKRIPYENLTVYSTNLCVLQLWPLTMMLRFVFNVVKLAIFCAWHRFDIVHINFGSPLYFYFRVLRYLGGPPFVITFRGSDCVYLHRVQGLPKQLFIATLKGASALTAVSGALAERVSSGIPGHPAVLTVHNGVNLSHAQNLGRDAELVMQEHGLQPGKFALLAANFTNFKGHDVAVRAWHTVLQSRPDLKLVFAGQSIKSSKRDQGLESGLRQLVAELRLDDRVLFIGSQPRSTVFALMREAMCLLAPSTADEGFGMVLIEAGAVGLPVIGSNIGPFREILDGGQTGILVEMGDSEAFAEAVLRLANDPVLRDELGDRFRQSVEQEFSLAAAAANYESIYRSCMKGSLGDVPWRDARRKDAGQRSGGLTEPSLEQDGRL